MYFRTNGYEALSTSPEDVASQTTATNELEGAPGGIIGFSLDFVQGNC